MFIKTIKYLQRSNVILFILQGIVVIILISAISSLIIHVGNNENPAVESIKNKGIYFYFFSTVILAPILETLIFQFLPFSIANSKFKHKKRLYVYLILASTFFGLAHLYNLSYLFFGLITGFVLAFFFYVGTLRKENAVLLMFIIHSFYNLLLFALSQI